MVYFETADEAQQDGYRPCQKCKPDDLGFVGQREQIVLSALDLLRVRKDDEILKWSLKELAKEVGVTPSYLCRAFKKTMGTTIGEYMKQFERQESSSIPADASKGLGLADLDTRTAAPLTQAPTQRSSPTTEYSTEVLDNYHENRAGMPILPALSSGSGTTAESSPAAPSDLNCQSSKRNEEVLDLDFDFDEWVWTEGLPVTTGF